MRAPVLLALLALLVAPCRAAGEGLLSRVMASVWDVVFRSFAEASGYKVEALPPPPPKKKHSEEKQAVVHTSKSFHTTTERVVSMTETFTSSDDDTSAPHAPFNFYHSSEHSSHWPADSEDNNDGRHAKDDDDHADAGDKENAKEKEPQESKRMRIKPIKVTKRIKSQRSGSEEKISFRQIDKQGPKKQPAKSEPLVIKLLSATPTKGPTFAESPTPTKSPTLHDSWPSVWLGAH